MKIYFKIFCFLILSMSYLLSESFNIKALPIQEHGRIKPLDTFARNQMLSFFGKRTLSHKELNHDSMDAITWLIDLLSNSPDIYEKDVFNITNPEIVGTLGLDWKNNFHRYNYIEIFNGIKEQFHYFKAISNKSELELTQKDKDYLQIYNNAIQFNAINKSLYCLFPAVKINNQYVADQMDVDLEEYVSYAFFVLHIDKFRNLLKDFMKNTNNQNWNASDSTLSRITFNLDSMEKNSFSRILKVIPPDPYHHEYEWLSPWELLEKREITHNQSRLIISLEKYFKYHLNDDEKNKNFALKEYYKALFDITSINIQKLEREVWYNEANLFYYSLGFYLLAFILLCVSWVLYPNIINKVALVAVIIGFLFHFYGILNRIIIMERPPVTTLYESIIFVGIISVLFGLIIEYARKDGLGVLLGSISGSILHYVSFGYASDGDTLGMLVAVLNTNFWLATHVTTITIGYGVSIIASLMGHLYLLQSIIDPSNKEKLNETYKNTLGITIGALFFTSFGTILGGIWADQSWGRFWGWDPKENGALLIVLWLLMMLHLRIANMVKAQGFAFGMIFTNIIVSIAWFGVNLLNVGLHSYGFTDNVANNLAVFILFEIILGTFLFFASKRRAISIKN